MLEANPIHIWKLQTKANLFQHVSNFVLPFCVFYRPDKNDVIKLFILNNSKSKTGRMFILHTFINSCTFCQSFSLTTLILCTFQTRTIFQLLVSKVHSANQSNFKLSQVGDFIMPSQSWKRQLKRLTTAVLISWSVFCKSGFRRILQRWRHNVFFINSWPCLLREGLIFRTHITFNQFYCFAKFQCHSSKKTELTRLRFYLFRHTLQI